MRKNNTDLYLMEGIIVCSMLALFLHLELLHPERLIVYRHTCCNLIVDHTYLGLARIFRAVFIGGAVVLAVVTFQRLITPLVVEQHTREIYLETSYKLPLDAFTRNLPQGHLWRQPAPSAKALLDDIKVALCFGDSQLSVESEEMLPAYVQVKAIDPEANAVILSVGHRVKFTAMITGNPQFKQLFHPVLTLPVIYPGMSFAGTATSAAYFR